MSNLEEILEDYRLGFLYADEFCRRIVDFLAVCGLNLSDERRERFCRLEKIGEDLSQVYEDTDEKYILSDTRAELWRPFADELAEILGDLWRVIS